MYCQNKSAELFKYHEGSWQCIDLKGIAGPVWCVDWSITGDMLSVSCGDNTVNIYNV